ncbi:MAG: hypothetical protein KJ970_06965 [Candidatus Eisenbacteria bacterium]|uniref:Uncharacterized protein n=1 Tax=Eiseniibacteriota bacterium TaxID=2212470 RepID=A0A948WC71_UNCEI|nr:hypothetical protein [Candidatus Eisenbacteria bacterium]MBU2690653.1 hypothetical protein [Candidatus Eisenbacteria bacterium]
MDPLQFATRVLDLHGAVVEGKTAVDAHGNQICTLHTLLPAELAARLEWEEESRLATRPGTDSNLRLIGYGSADLEMLLDLVRTQCSAVRIRGDLPWPRPRSLANEAQEAFRFRTRVQMTLRETQPSHANYLLVHYLLNAVSEETYESLIATMVNQATLSPVGELIQQIGDPQVFVPRRGGDLMGGGTLKEVAQALQREASRMVHRRLDPFRESLDRRRNRDAQRLHGYYEALAQEVCRRKTRGRKLSATQVDAKLESIRGEYDRKVRDLDMRYALRVRLKPAAVMQVDMPVLRATYDLRYRREERILPITWNSLLGRLESIPCDECGKGSLEMTIDDRLRVLCLECAGKSS